MSDAETDEAQNEDSEPGRVTETRTELTSRHKTETRELEVKKRSLIKQANKNKKKTAEAEAAGRQVRLPAYASLIFFSISGV